MIKIKRLHLLLTTLLLAASVAVTLTVGQRDHAKNYAFKLAAAEKMEESMSAIRGYRMDAGLVINDDDLHGTGMIGLPYTMITTTSGALEAKRTTANSDMAALVVELLGEAGIESGDRVAAGFSGSFPAMNLAVLSACAVMDVDLVYIASVGASTYGANQPELTFPDMAYRLVEDGILPQHGVAISMGGGSDCGLDMEPTLRDGIIDRLEGYSVPLMMEEDFEKNIAQRHTLYEAGGEISCYIGVGGNITTSGLDGTTLSWGVIAPDEAKSVGPRTGMMERYNAQGLPVIHFLNIKRLVADYALPYDPATLPAMGTSSIYYDTYYDRWFPMMGLLGSAVLLWCGRIKKEAL